jgi:hypothetical protein
MRLAAALVVLATLLACASAVAGEDPQFRPNPADMTAARASLLRSSDLGAAWKGGPKKAARPQGLDCPAHRAKQSELVVTGAAQAEFRTVGDLDIQSQVEVMQDEAMVRADLTRTARTAVVRCLAAGLERSGSLLGARVISTKRVPFPRLGDASAAYRIVAELPAEGPGARIVVDVIAIGVRRTETSLVGVAPALTGGALLVVEQRLARVLFGRARP